MSKSSRKKAYAGKQAKAHKQKILPLSNQVSKRGKSFATFAIVTILVATPFCMGKYFEFNFPDPFDSGAYIYSAKHILDGAEIGVEEKPSAHIGTLLMNMVGVWLFGFNETGPQVIMTILQMVALLIMFIAMRKFFGILPAAVGLIVASIYLSAPLIAKYGNVKEQYMIAFMIMGISCFVSAWYFSITDGFCGVDRAIICMDDRLECKVNSTLHVCVENSSRYASGR